MNKTTLWLGGAALSLLLGGAQAQSLDALLARAHGRVLEIGFGTGANLPHLPAAVTSLVAIEPSEGLAARARARLARWDRPHEVLVQSGGEPLPYPDASFDVAVITFVLCSVRQAAPLLAQTRRLLKPGAPLLLAEHIVARPAPLRALQTALRPAWKACLGGCDPTSDPRTALVDAGPPARRPTSPLPQGIEKTLSALSRPHSTPRPPTPTSRLRQFSDRQQL